MWMKIKKQEVHDMKKIFFITLVLGMISSVSFAQDDMYFVPKKSSKETKKEFTPVTHSGSMRDVDEYNRRGGFKSTYSALDNDSTSNDVIHFETGTYADSLSIGEYAGQYETEDDYAYCRRMSRFDDFYWYDPWYCGWYGSYWYGSPYWHAHYGWYDPWFDPWYYGWYRPWGYYGWYYPGYWHGAYYRPYRGITGTSNHGRVNYGYAGNAGGNFRGYRGTNNRTGNNNRYDNSDRNNNYNNSNFRGNRSNSYSRPDTQTKPSYSTGSSFGGNRGGGFSGGGSFGGSRGGGGGSFRGRR